MDPACLQYRLTPQERRSFEQDGLFYVEDALSAEQVKSLSAVVDRIYEEELGRGAPTDTVRSVPNFIPRDPALLALVDYDRIFPKVWGLLGWNIYLYHAHLNVTPPSGAQPSDATFSWHQDSARVNVEMESHPRPRLSLKVGYFLSDTSKEGRGNFWVVPGSHLCDALQRPENGRGQPDGAVPVLAKEGTAVFFDRRLWHAATPNWSDITRKVLFYGYGYRWIRTKDDMTVEALWPASSPIRRQLLGWSTNANGRFHPTEEDVPLRQWLKTHCPEDAPGSLLD
jgi:ectoine hydroxylase